MKGAVFPLVLIIVLAVTLMLTALFQLPGNVGRVALIKARELQKIYDEESALLAFFNGYPEGYFQEAPWSIRLQKVKEMEKGPWVDFHVDSGRVHVMAGRHYDSLSRQEKMRMGTKFRLELNSSIESAPGMVRKSGNRRLMGRGRDMNFVAESGDLTVDWDGHVGVCNFKSSGNMELWGNMSIDTLRVYASGNLKIGGNVRVQWLEAYSESSAEVAGEASYSGMLMAYQGVILRRPGAARFPAGAMALNGALEVPTGGTRAKDSLRLLLPASSEDSPLLLEPFQWSLQ